MCVFPTLNADIVLSSKLDIMFIQTLVKAIILSQF